MILDCAKYSGPCSCGREHPLETQMVVVEYDALKNFDRYMEQCGLTGRRTVLYDTNTYNLPGMVHVPADKEIVLEAQGLHSEKNMIEAVIPQLDDPDVIVTVGSGTLMDFARYPAHKLGVPFVAIPTLASSDGFTANICSIVIDGQKKSIPLSLIHISGVDMSTGSLGQGLSAAVGMALAGKLDGADYRVYALMGDGEIEEGQIWEACLLYTSGY